MGQRQGEVTSEYVAVTKHDANKIASWLRRVQPRGNEEADQLFRTITFLEGES